MPATAGRVRMPANNRVHSSAALQTHGIWQSAIGYDPYAPNKDDSNKASQVNKSSNSEPDPENAYASFQGLLALARITGSNADEARGSCKKCGRVGHLTFQCRNFLSLKEDKEKDPLALQAAVASGLDKLKANGAKMDNKADMESSEESSEEEETDDSDSDVDSEIERIITARSGKKSGGKTKSSSKKKRTSDDDESDSGDRKKRGRSKKRRSRKRAATDSNDEDEDEVDRKRQRERSKRRNVSSEEDDERHHRHRKSRKEKRRRRSHKHSDDSDGSEESHRRHKRKSRRAASLSDSGACSSDDPRVGRGMKRSEKRNRKHQREEKV